MMGKPEVIGCIGRNALPRSLLAYLLALGDDRIKGRLIKQLLESAADSSLLPPYYGCFKDHAIRQGKPTVCAAAEPGDGYCGEP